MCLKNPFLETFYNEYSVCTTPTKIISERYFCFKSGGDLKEEQKIKFSLYKSE